MKKVFSILMVALMGLALCVTVACNKDDNSTNNTENNGGNNGSNNGGDNGGGDTTIVNDVWVDLGLPSGTMWKNANEVNAADAYYNFYTYDEAVAAFGDALPTKEQWEELKDSCQLTWNGGGYTVTGPNGNSIVLPAAGYRTCLGGEQGVGGPLQLLVFHTQWFIPRQRVAHLLRFGQRGRGHVRRQSMQRPLRAACPRLTISSVCATARSARRFMTPPSRRSRANGTTSGSPCTLAAFGFEQSIRFLTNTLQS